MKDPKDTLVLIVDDEESLRKAIAFEFQRRGYQILTAENGVVAREMVGKAPVDVVISDVRMPGGDGVELVRTLKTNAPARPVAAFVTGFADITIDEAYDLGADAVFSKPFSRAALRDFVARAGLSLEERWNGSAPQDASIVDGTDSLEGEAAGQVARVTLGRGGMFVAVESGHLKVDTRVRFSFVAPEGEIEGPIEGVGIVRWTRSLADGPKLAGCGIEFESLSPSCRERIIRSILARERRPFIPAS